MMKQKERSLTDKIFRGSVEPVKTVSMSLQSPTKHPRNKSVIGHHNDKPAADNKEEYEVNFNERTTSAMKRRVSAPDSVFNSVMDLP